MDIRHAKYNDIEQVVKIYNSAIPDKLATADLTEQSVYEKMDWFCKHSEHKYPLLVAEANKQIIGWASISAFYGRPAYAKTAEISIYILKSHQNKGIATKLLSKLLEKAKQNGFQQILAYVFKHNEASINFFEKCGFIKRAELPQLADMEGFMADLIILQKSI